MKAILVHANNIYEGLNKKFAPELSLLFQFSGHNDIDFKLTEFIEKEIFPKNPSSIFIKTSLSDNYLEFLGIRLAYHIRLSMHPDISKIPIVLIGEESYEELLRLSENSDILSTKGLYLSTGNPETIDKYLKAFENGVLAGCPKIAEFVEKVHISMPANYQSHHSITNEWSILRWARALNIDISDAPISDIKAKIEGYLFYKYLLTKYPEITEPDKLTIDFKGKGKVLLIDDEWNKGWKTIFEKIFSEASAENIDFITFEESFKEKQQDKILNLISEFVKKHNPDIIILDLKLTDGDFSASIKPDDLTGYKVLKNIKKINPGYQVIIFTASNKVWNLIALQQAGSDGFILKESPELSISKDYARDNINALITTISACLSNAYLKDIYSFSKTIKEDLGKNTINKKYFDKDLKEQLKGSEYNSLINKYLDIIFSILRLNNADKFNLTIIMMYIIIECINKIIFREKFFREKNRYEHLFWDDEELKLYDTTEKKFSKSYEEPKKINSAGNKIHSIIKRFEIDPSYHERIDSLTDHRNNIIHPDAKKINIVSSENIVEWLGLIKEIIKSISVKP